MQVKIQVIPEQGAQSINKMTVTSRDAQGIMMEEQVLESAEEPGGQSEGKGAKRKTREGEEPPKMETQIHLPVNGTIKITNIGEPMQVDSDQRAGVPDSAEEIQERRRAEDQRKADADPFVRRKEAYMMGVPPTATGASTGEKNFAPATAQGTTKSSAGKVEESGGKADLSHTLSPSTKDESHDKKK